MLRCVGRPGMETSLKEKRFGIGRFHGRTPGQAHERRRQERQSSEDECKFCSHDEVSFGSIVKLRFPGLVRLAACALTTLSATGLWSNKTRSVSSSFSSLTLDS